MPKWFRFSLYSAAFINLITAIVFFPRFSGLRGIIGLPSNTDPLYLSIFSGFIAVFAFAYYYLASSKTNNRLFIIVSIFTKLILAFSMLYYGIFRSNSLLAIVAALPDLALAILFTIWLQQYLDLDI